MHSRFPWLQHGQSGPLKAGCWGGLSFTPIPLPPPLLACASSAGELPGSTPTKEGPNFCSLSAMLEHVFPHRAPFALRGLIHHHHIPAAVGVLQAAHKTRQIPRTRRNVLLSQAGSPSQ